LAALARYVERQGGCALFDHSDARYFPSGEEAFEEMLRQLEQARSFIFLEYFIIAEGYMWGRILKVLEESNFNLLEELKKTGIDGLFVSMQHAETWRFTREDYLVYDKYGDGDPYEDEDYVARFRFLTEAVRERTPIRIRMQNKYGRTVYFKCLPLRLEYSEKDDKFRLITRGCHFMPTVKLSSILSCTPCNDGKPIGGDVREPQYEEAVLRVTDERNALERVMLHFAHFEKRAEKLDGNRYLVRLRYATDDANELVIRILSFGPMVEVIGPDSFRASVIAKLKSQMACGL